MKKIFNITSPLSSHLQSPTLDFIQALILVDNAKKALIKLRTEESFQNLMDEAKDFAIVHEVEEINLKNE